MDIDWLKSINQSGSGFKDDYSSVMSKSVTPVTIAVPVGLFVAGWAENNRKLKMDAAYFAGGYLVSAIITHGTKKIIQRQRPYDRYVFITKRDNADGYSFPSGHTSAAFYTATSLSMMYPKWYVIAPVYLWASSVGWARMYQGVHYPTDVLTGAVVGAGSAWLTYKAQQWINKKKGVSKTAPGL